MSDKYILAELSSRNEFRCDMSVYFNNIKYTTNIKIDTGAVNSLFPLHTLGLSDKHCKEIKEFCIKANLGLSTLRGVERVNNFSTSQLKELSFEDKMNSKGIAFKADIVSLFVDNYYLGNRTVKISCDTIGNILLGMDILKDFDIHIGVSRLTNKSTFIGCEKSLINEDYLKALQDNFSYIPESFLELAYQNGIKDASKHRIDQVYVAASWNDFTKRLKEKKKDIFHKD